MNTGHKDIIFFSPFQPKGELKKILFVSSAIWLLYEAQGH